MAAHPDKEIRWKQFARLGHVTRAHTSLTTISHDPFVAKSVRDEALSISKQLEAFRAKYTNAINNVKATL